MIRYIFIILLTLTNFIYSQSRKCGVCGGEIKGRYIQVANKYFHPEHFKCSKCGNLISGEYTVERGKYFHKNCFYQELGLKCSKCNQLIKGKYFTINNKNYHPECLDVAKTKCDFCGKPINGKYFIENGKNYHPNCYDRNIAIKCDVCLEPIKGNYTIDNHGNKYHNEHKNIIPSCDNCGRIISRNTTGGGKRYSDGREVCNLCYNKSVSGYQNIEVIYNKVLSILAALGIKIESQNIKLIPSDRNELRNEAGNNYSKTMKGYCRTEVRTTFNGDFQTVEKNFSMYILDSVPREYIAATIAHELMHIWIIENTENNQNSLLTEGSCNYASYLYLRSQNTLLSKEVIEALENDPDRIYGEGFRTARSKFQNIPVSGFLDYLRTNYSF